MHRIALAVLHLAALGIGLGAVWARARALGERPLGGAAARRAFSADGWWAAAAGLWIATGLWRLLAGTEKATSYYFGNHVFYAKMGFLVLILALEVYPIVTLIRWRRTAARGGADFTPDAREASRIRALSYAQVVLVLAMVTAAVMMARGYGVRGGG